jgi:hypothetical protein
MGGLIEGVLRHHGERIIGEVGWELWTIPALPFPFPARIAGELSRKSRMGHDV